MPMAVPVLSFLLCLCLGLIQANPCSDQKDVEVFAADAAFGSYVMTVEDVRFFFDKNFPEKNKLPTVNMNLTGEPSVLTYAPSFKTSFRFPTAVKMDLIMTNSDKGDSFYLVGASPSEKIGTIYYFLEFLHKSSKIYKEFLNSPPNLLKEECSCINQPSTRERVVVHLNTLAQIMRGLYPHPREDGTRVWTDESASGKSLYKKRMDSCQKPDLDIHAKQFCGELPPSLMDSVSWKYWKDMKRGSISDNSLRNLALYMFCHTGTYREAPNFM